ncbi:methionine biosynthesis protein MetW [Sulfurisoma sediminicola]|uniref:Methionine biosynthesis protein MetW n=1 Tax=Sulfurisoma sediminicola TaxID=1381557 RepID=A0A497XPP0_9PROT|nr:methionine biosynthesis protein MetW [Sulfurisoma sediminicola]RLJ68119.1 methionine biosynthesis protein MetW [Sulfurisoma sediminicola]
MTENAIALGRPDFDVISGWVQPNERVLDLGCGDGSLLKLLIATRGVRGWGIEIDNAGVLKAIGNGINVIQSDLEVGLSGFENGEFDHVVLSRTLQTVRHTQRIIEEMLRVGREAVVSFPNFAYWKNRMAVMAGRMPVSEDLPYQWFDTPNIRFFTIADFDALCAAMRIVVRERMVLDDKGNTVKDEQNFLGSLAVYRLARA